MANGWDEAGGDGIGRLLQRKLPAMKVRSMNHPGKEIQGRRIRGIFVSMGWKTLGLWAVQVHGLDWY